MDAMTSLAVRVRKAADEHASKARHAREDGDAMKAEFESGQHCALLSVIHVLIDDFGVDAQAVEELTI